MNANKHTPAPWILRGDWVATESGEVIAATSESGAFVAVDQDWIAQNATFVSGANAHLIAAAPELLEACRAVVERWEHGDLAEAARMCDAAIAKAEGRVTS